MKTVILAGGRGTRIGEETHLRPKPVIEIGMDPCRVTLIVLARTAAWANAYPAGARAEIAAYGAVPADDVS